MSRKENPRSSGRRSIYLYSWGGGDRMCPSARKAFAVVSGAEAVSGSDFPLSSKEPQLVTTGSGA